MEFKYQMTQEDVDDLVGLLTDAGLYIVEEWVTEIAMNETGDEDPYPEQALIYRALGVEVDCPPSRCMPPRPDVQRDATRRR